MSVIEAALPSDTIVEIGCALSATLIKTADQSREDRWSALSSDGWHLAGRDEDDGPIPMVDLCHLAEVAGAGLCDVPLTSTLLVHRWDIPGDSEAWAIAIPHGEDVVAAAHADLPGVNLYGVQSEHGGHLLSIDDFAATLPVASIAGSGTLGVTQLTEARAAAVAEAIGAAQAAFDAALEYARQREQFGRAIGTFQAIQHHFANMHRDLELARALVLQVLSSTGRRQDRATTQALGMARTIAERSMHVFGGIGFTEELALDRPLRHVIASTVLLDGNW